MSVRDRQFVKFTVALIALSVVAMALIIYLAEHHSYSGGSAVGSGLAIIGLILILGPVGVIFAGYASWFGTGQSRQFPRSGFALRLPVYVVLAILLWYGLAYVTEGFGLTLDTVIYFPAVAAVLAALAAASVSFDHRIVRTTQYAKTKSPARGGALSNF
jgi:hypothetical protein